MALEPGVSAVAVQRASCNAPLSSPFFLLEAIAQLGGIAAGREEGGGGILAAIERAEFDNGIMAGDTLLFSVRIVKSFGQLQLVEGEVMSDGVKRGSATLTLKVGTMP